jgi:hypothetical protein
MDLPQIALTEEIRGEAILPREVDGGEGARPVTVQFETTEQDESFATWLRQHDAEVAAKALEEARDEIRAKLATFPWGGRNTRAGWAATWLEYIAARIRREAGAS